MRRHGRYGYISDDIQPNKSKVSIKYSQGEFAPLLNSVYYKQIDFAIIIFLFFIFLTYTYTFTLIKHCYENKKKRFLSASCSSD